MPVSSAPIKNAYLEINSHGKIVSLNTMNKEIEGLEYYSGVLVPGFVWICKNKKNEVRVLNPNKNSKDSFLYLKGIQATNCCENVKAINKFYKNMQYKNIDEVIKNNTIKPAKQMSNKLLGSFDIGKIPGVLLLTGFDFENNFLSSEMKIIRLV